MRIVHNNKAPLAVRAGATAQLLLPTLMGDMSKSPAAAIAVSSSRPSHIGTDAADAITVGFALVSPGALPRCDTICGREELRSTLRTELVDHLLREQLRLPLGSSSRRRTVTRSSSDQGLAVKPASFSSAGKSVVGRRRCKR